MKNFLLIISMFFIIDANSQKIKYDENNILPDYLIVEAKGSQYDLYTKSLNWVKKFYKNPESVITAKTENELIKINGACVNCLVMNIIGSKFTNTLRYIITLEFKDNKYKFEISSVTFENTDDLKNGNIIMFKENGKLRGPYKNYPIVIEDELNNLFNSLKVHVENEKEDW